MRTIGLIIPAYNSEKYIKRCLDSILSQTYKDAQIIIVDDASTDATPFILDDYTNFFNEKGFEYHVIHLKENQGQASCFNHAFKILKTRFLMWLDSDDFLYQNSFEKRVLYMKMNPQLDLCICNGDVYNYPNYEDIVDVQKKENKNQNYFIDVLKMGDVVWVPGSIFAKTDYFFTKVKKPFIYPSRQGQNIQMMLPLLFKAKYGFIDESLYGIVSHSDSHSRRILSSDDYIKRGKEFINVFKKTLSNMYISILRKHKYISISKKVLYLDLFYYCLAKRMLLKSMLFYCHLSFKDKYRCAIIILRSIINGHLTI